MPEGITQVLSSLDFIERGYNLCILGDSDAGKFYLAKAIGIKACNRYNVGYFHSEELLESMVALNEIQTIGAETDGRFVLQSGRYKMHLRPLRDEKYIYEMLCICL